MILPIIYVLSKLNDWTRPVGSPRHLSLKLCPSIIHACGRKEGWLPVQVTATLHAIASTVLVLELFFPLTMSMHLVCMYIILIIHRYII